MVTRRQFLGALACPGLASVTAPALDPHGALRAIEAAFEHRSLPPERAAQEEALWFEVQQAYTVDRSLMNLNNGGVSPAPRIAQEAMKRHLDYSNQAPATTMWHVLEPQREPVRDQLARTFGAGSDEIALVRNASEGLQICQLGLDLEPGDEVLTTNQDYPRMITTFQQRERREGIKLVQIPNLPVPCEDPGRIVELFESHITERTRLILMCHVINLTGQILPVRAIVRMARSRGIPVIVDGAHAFAHFAFQRSDLECDYYATSLHKWLGAPHGTGLLYVRKERIPELWPLMAAQESQDSDIRKFEEIGTHPAAHFLAIAESLAFHHGIGAERKEARLRYLRDRWAKRLLENDRVRLHTSLKPQLSCGIATVQIEGVDTAGLRGHLWSRHRILTVAIAHDEFEGLRVSPNVYTTPDEIDRFCEAVEDVLENGLPS